MNFVARASPLRPQVIGKYRISPLPAGSSPAVRLTALHSRSTGQRTYGFYRTPPRGPFPGCLAGSSRGNPPQRTCLIGVGFPLPGPRVWTFTSCSIDHAEHTGLGSYASQNRYAPPPGAPAAFGQGLGAGSSLLLERGTSGHGNATRTDVVEGHRNDNQQGRLTPVLAAHHSAAGGLVGTRCRKARTLARMQPDGSIEPPRKARRRYGATLDHSPAPALRPNSRPLPCADRNRAYQPAPPTASSRPRRGAPRARWG